MSEPVRAVLLVLFACAFFAGANAFAKAVGLAAGDEGTIHPLQIALARFFFGFLTVLPALALVKKVPLRPRAPLKLHLGRVACGLGGLICGFTALTVLPLADVIAIAFSSPLFTMILAVMFLGEAIGVRRSAAALVGFIGVLIMARPGPETFQVIALVALLGALFTGAEVVFLRRLAARDHPLTVLFINNGLGTVMALALAWPVLRWPGAAEWPLLAAVGVTMVTGQFIFVRAMAKGEAGFLAPYYYSNLLYAAFYGYVFFAEIPGWHVYAGAALIIASGVYVSLREEKISATSRHMQ